MSQAPAMPLFWGDYWSKTRRLSPAQHHAYLFLLGATWMNNCVPLPDNDETIAGEIGITLSAWRRVRPALVRFFDLSEGTWRNHKLEEVWASVMDRVEKNRENGRLGGRPKKYHADGKNQKNQTPEKPDGSLSVNPNESIQNQNQKEEDTKAIALGADAPRDLVKELWDLGKQMLGASAGSLIGKARKQYGDLVTMEALLAVRAGAPSDPVEFFIGCLKEKKRGRSAHAAETAAFDFVTRRAADWEPDSPAPAALLVTHGTA